MGNDNKVSRNLARRTEVFFRDNTVEAIERPVLYSLEDEFAKTKKRKNILVYAGAILFAVALVAITLTITAEIEQRNSTIKVDVSDFRDLNLTDLLQNTKKDEIRLRSLMREIEDRRQSWRLERQKVKDRYRTEYDILTIHYAAIAERQGAVAGLKTKELAELAALDARYRKAIHERQQEVDEISKRLAGRDTKMLQGAQEMELVLGSQLKLREIEQKKVEDDWRARFDEAQQRSRAEGAEQRKLQKKLIETLILRYNPVFSEPALKNLLASSPASLAATLEYPWQALLGREGVIDKADFDALRKNAAEERLLLQRLIAVGYTNSVGPALSALGQRQENLIAGYERLWRGLAERIEQKNARLEAYEKAFLSLMQRTREHGYILATRKSGRHPAIINPAYPVRSGDLAIVIRGENTRIGTVRLERTGDGLVAIPVGAFSLAPAPLDTLLLQLRQLAQE